MDAPQNRHSPPHTSTVGSTSVEQTAQCAPDANAAWYLIQCRAQQEERALQHLQNQRFHCLFPWLNSERIRRGKREAQREPLFPGYLFIQLNDNQNWSSIRSTRGVRQLVRFGGQPAQVPQTIIDQLQQHQLAQNVQRPALQAGDILRITSGPFAQLQAIFHRFDGNERVIVLLELLQKQHQLKLKLSDISPQ